MMEKTVPNGLWPTYRSRITNRARLLAETIHTECEPILVPYERTRGCQIGECFANVRNLVALIGGEVVNGWVFWETPPLLVQAEFHSIWAKPDGKLIDVTPPLHKGASVTFLRAASGDSYNGTNQPAHSMVYEDTPIAQRFLKASKRFIALAYPEGEIQTPTFKLTKEMQLILREKGEILREVYREP